MLRSAFPMRPSAVSAPVWRTAVMPRPLTTSVPENTQGVASPPGAPIASVAVPGRAAVLRTGMASPVSAASSTVRFEQSISTPSAGTRSPSTRSTTSPRTTSRPAIRCWCPSRMTSARGEERSRSAVSAFSVLCSWYSEMAITTTTNDIRMTPSSGSASRKYKTPAPTSSSSIGSRSTSRPCCKRLRGFAVGSSFGPSAASRQAASSSVRPTIVEGSTPAAASMDGTVIAPAPARCGRRRGGAAGEERVAARPARRRACRR